MLAQPVIRLGQSLVAMDGLENPGMAGFFHSIVATVKTLILPLQNYAIITYNKKKGKVNDK